MQGIAGGVEVMPGAQLESARLRSKASSPVAGGCKPFGLDNSSRREPLFVT